MVKRLPRKIKKHVKKYSVLFEKRVYGIDVKPKNLRLKKIVTSGNLVIFTKEYAKA
jgi:hypothetical protein